jgi:signal transduction histidine kinase/CheY-like chemotaxis protein
MLESPKVHILLVDDNPANLIAIEAILAQLGQEVVTATSGTDALKKLLYQDFAVIILDVRMPDMDGFETASLIRTRDRNRATPIIFLTAHTGGEQQVLRAYELGAVDFLQKPVVAEVLRGKVAVFVELFRKTLEVRRQGELLRELEKKEHARALDEARQRWESEALRQEAEQSRRVADALAAKNAELAVSIRERERAEENLRQAVQRLRILSETATRLLMAVPPREVLHDLFEPLSAHLGLDVYFMHLTNGDGLHLDGCRGVPLERAEELAAAVCARACHGAAERRERVGSDGEPIVDEALAELGLTCWICIPLLGQSRFVGTLFFGSRRRLRFDSEDLAVMQVCADQIAMALDRVNLFRELERRNDELAESDQRKDEFLAMLGHELRNPLAPLVTALQVLRLRKSDDPTVVKAERAMDRQLRHIVRLVDDLLDVSRINRGKIELKFETVELAGIIEHAIHTSRPLIEEHRHAFHVDLPHDRPRVTVDPTRISQVVSNLLNNAAKYTPRGGRIWLTVMTSGRDLEIRVRDDGMGIDDEMMPRVFELFVQAPRAADRSLGGLGIGLSLVRSLVELHGGQISGTSEGRGHGSEFRVTLPGVVEPAYIDVVEVVDAESSAGHSMSPLRILVVEDNSDIRETLKDLLIMCGHTVDVAEDGERGLQMVLDLKPNVALIDIGLPGLDGYGVAKTLRLRMGGDLHTRLIALTGYGQPDDKRKALDAGFDAHLVKPVDLEHLSEVLREQSPS